MKKLFTAAIFCLAIAPIAGHSHNVQIPKNIDELVLTKMTDSVYVVHGIIGMPDKNNKGFISNSGFVVSSEGVVIVDTGGSLQIGEMLLQKIQEVTSKPVIAVFNTHLHGDHWLGNVAFRKAYPDVPIYAHERAIERLSNGEAEQWLDIFTQATNNTIEGTTIVLPDHALKGGESIDIAGSTYKIHHTGHAHTDNDIMIEYPKDKTLFSGDIVIYGSMVSGARPEDFSAKGQIKAVEYALSLPIDIYVPGHGPTGGREIPEATKRFLEVLYASVQRYYDEGLEDFEMRDKVIADLKEFSDWSGFDRIGSLINSVYLQVEAAEFE
ncbi:MAG: MBL fold metallo-hydrolase [Thiotrichaceae bacterium]|nr:MAG: MBL fold metallo-hydrolase [Thiotrichaceae bacterium]